MSTLIPGVAGEFSVSATTLEGTTGLPTDVKEYAGTTLVRETATVYGSWNGSSCAALGSYINDRPCDIKITNGAGAVQAETRNTYDAKGNPVTISKWTGSSWLNRYFPDYRP